MRNGFFTTARIAGLIYLAVAVCGLFAQLVRVSVIDSGDATATADNIRDAEWLFRASFSSDMVTFSADVALAVVLYLLFRPVNQAAALLAASFRLAQAATLGINMLNQFMALLLISGEDYLTAFDPDQIDALVLLSMQAHNYGYLIGLVFFAVSTFFLGYLILTSGYFPKWLGALFMTIVPLGYMLDSFGYFLFQHEQGVVSFILVTPAALIELFFVLWLLVRGANVPAAVTPR